MKISKLLPVLCALAVGALGLTSRAEDTPAAAPAKTDASAPAAADKNSARQKAVQPKAKKAKPAKSGSAQGNAYPGADLGFQPIPAPPVPLSAGKADRLAALLGKYKLDQVSPEEYHQQRAAILAEP
jgi:hypothetical protein